MTGGPGVLTGTVAAERQAAPRLDWRFLLSDPELDRVGFVGRSGGGLLDSLRLLCRSVDVVSPVGQGNPGPTAQSYELVVACEPSEAELRLAAARVKPGGTLVVETRGPIEVFGAKTKGRGDGRGGWRHLRPPAWVVRSVRGLGFEDARSYWHWPDFDGCTRIVPLDDRMALLHALSRTRGGMRSQVLSWLGAKLMEMGLLGWVVACATTIAQRARVPELEVATTARRKASKPARRPDRIAPRSVPIRGFLHDHWDRLGLERHAPSRRLSFVVLTPRFRNSSHLVFLLLPEDGAQPVLVAKVPRRRGECRKVAREAERLRQIQATRPGGFESIPRLVAFEACGDRMILVETALQGRAMDRATVSRDAAQCCEATLAWLMEVQTATRSVPGPGEKGLERLVERTLLDVELVCAAEPTLIERTRELMAPLSAARLSFVLEHGDLSHPNLLVDSRGRAAVMDWELAEWQGLPASDLFFFLAYVARAVHGARSSAESVLALERAFFGRRSWGRTYVRRYAQALGLPHDTLTPLFIACWLRQVAGLSWRIASGGEDPPMAGGELADWLRRDWRFGAWRHAVEHASRLDWEDLP